MVKISKDMLDELYVVLVSHYYNCGSYLHRDYEFIKRVLQSSAPEYDKIRKTVSNVYNRRSNRDRDADGKCLQKLIETFEGLMKAEKEGSSQGDGDLLETVIEILQHAYGRNVISGSTLTALRDALLLPQERTKLLTRTSKMEGYCGNCGVLLHNGDMCTYSNDGYGPYIVCLKCKHPSTQPCAQCTKSVPLDKSIVRALRNMPACEKHQEAPSPKESEANPSNAVLQALNRERDVQARRREERRRSREGAGASIGASSPAQVASSPMFRGIIDSDLHFSSALDYYGNSSVSASLPEPPPVQGQNPLIADVELADIAANIAIPEGVPDVEAAE